MITLNANGYYCTTSRGVSYVMRVDSMGRFEVSSQRLALRAARMGGSVRHFATIAEVEQNVKAFVGLTALVELMGETQ